MDIENYLFDANNDDEEEENEQNEDKKDEKIIEMANKLYQNIIMQYDKENDLNIFNEDRFDDFKNFLFKINKNIL